MLGETMKKYFLGLFLLLSSLLITGCGKNIIGKWRAIDASNEYYYIFNKDKTCSYKMSVASLDCTYEMNGEKLNILFKGNEKTITYQYHFEKGILIIKDSTGKENKFIKKR